MQSRALFLAHHADYRRRRELLMSLFISSTLLVLRRLFTVCHMPVPLADWIISGPFRRPTTKNAGYKISPRRLSVHAGAFPPERFLIRILILRCAWTGNASYACLRILSSRHVEPHLPSVSLDTGNILSGMPCRRR